MDSSICEVKFDDGLIESYFANQIAEEIYQRVDTDGYLVDEIKDIVDHKTDGSAVSSDEAYIEVNGQRRMRRTTKGWKLLVVVEWKSGNSSWETLADMKEAYPVKVAKYAIAKKIASMPGFQWWVPHTIRKKD